MALDLRLVALCLPILQACGGEPSSDKDTKVELGQLAFGPTESATVGECVATWIKLGFDVDADVKVTIDVSGADNVAIYSDKACATPVADRIVTIPKGANFADFGAKFLTAGKQTLDASAADCDAAETATWTVTAAP